MKLRSSHVGTVVLVILLALALVGVLAPVFGLRLDVVQSGSMAPAIGVGDLLVTTPCDPHDLKVGDVISFRAENGLVCHRIVAVDQANSSFYTKGDANPHQDPEPVPYGNVVGKATMNIPALGYAVGFLKSVYGWALIILIAVLVLVLGSGKPPAKKDEGAAPPEEAK